VVKSRDLKPPQDPSIFVPQWDRVKDFKFRYRQREILEELLKRNYGRIDAPVGAGKSTLMRLIPRLLPRAKIAIATMSVDVITDMQLKLLEDIPRVGLVHYASKKKGPRVNCYGLKSLEHCVERMNLAHE
jgi:hypothetical protein